MEREKAHYIERNDNQATYFLITMEAGESEIISSKR